MYEISELGIEVKQADSEVIELICLMGLANQTNQEKYELIKPFFERLNLYCDEFCLRLEKDTEKKIKRYIKKSLNKQKETKGKFLGLERIIYLDYPKYKNEDYSVKYNAKVNLVRKGEIRNSVKGENNYE